MEGLGGVEEGVSADRPDEEQKEKMEWFENMASNGHPKGLRGERVRFVDFEEIDRFLSKLHAGGVLEVKEWV